jgi:hypothetical protein
MRQSKVLLSFFSAQTAPPTSPVDHHGHKISRRDSPRDSTLCDQNNFVSEESSWPLTPGARRKADRGKYL